MYHMNLKVKHVFIIINALQAFWFKINPFDHLADLKQSFMLVICSTCLPRDLFSFLIWDSNLGPIGEMYILCVHIWAKPNSLDSTRSILRSVLKEWFYIESWNNIEKTAACVVFIVFMDGFNVLNSEQQISREIINSAGRSYPFVITLLKL